VAETQVSQDTLQHQWNWQRHWRSRTSRTVWYPRPQHSDSHPSSPVNQRRINIHRSQLINPLFLMTIIIIIIKIARLIFFFFKKKN
jgi:hypothetical protein